VLPSDNDLRDRLDNAVEFTYSKRLVHEIIGARVQSQDLVALVGANRENQNREIPVPFPHGMNDLNAIGVRQAQIEDDQIGLPRMHLLQTFGNRCGLTHAVTLGAKSGAKHATDLSIILNEQNFRSWFGCSLGSHAVEPSASSVKSGGEPPIGRLIDTNAPPSGIVRALIVP